MAFAKYGFQGRESDTESGLQHFRARSYDPMTGRFTSRDPVPYPNLYIFPGNNPVNMMDPSGRDGFLGLPSWDEVEARARAMAAAAAAALSAAGTLMHQGAEDLRDLEDALPMGPSMVVGKAAGWLEIGSSAARGEGGELAFQVLVPDIVKAEVGKMFERVQIYSNLREQNHGVFSSAFIAEATIFEESVGAGTMYDSIDQYKRGAISLLHSMGKFQRGGGQFMLTCATIAGALPAKGPAVLASPKQWVVRGGLSAPETLIENAAKSVGEARTGLSCQTAPGMSVEQLARELPYSPKWITVSTPEELAAAGKSVGYDVEVVAPTPGPGKHGTITTPAALPEDLARALHKAFKPKPNPWWKPKT
ncbi:MAG: RHS repeat-associated core domain-containing protein [Planctomycetia bacterium]|nr:RHS repeat-associated core domain-containing protein [Planctomycetia bacterium]